MLVHKQRLMGGGGGGGRDVPPVVVRAPKQPQDDPRVTVSFYLYSFGRATSSTRTVRLERGGGGGVDEKKKEVKTIKTIKRNDSA